MQKRSGTPIGCLDLVLAWMVIGSFIFLFSGARISNSFGGTLFAMLFWVIVGSVAFAWRRGWIQRYRDNQQAKAKSERDLETQRRAEAQHLTATTVSEQDLEPLKADDMEYPVFRVHTPVTATLSATQVNGLIRAVLMRANSGFLELMLVGTRAGVHWQLTHFSGSQEEPEITPEELSEIFSTYYPGSVVERAPLKDPAKPLYRRYHVYKPKSVRYFDQALAVEDIKRDDPLTHVAQALLELEEGETVTYSVAVLSVATPDEQEIERVLTISAHDAGYRYQGMSFSGRNWEESLGAAVGSGIVTGLRNLSLRGQRVLAYSESETKYYLEKLTQPLAQCVISVTFDSPKKDRLKSIERFHGAVEWLSGAELAIAPEYTSPDIAIEHFEDWFVKTPVDYVQKLATLDAQSSDLAARLLFNLTVSELAALWHPAHEGFSADVLGKKGVHVGLPRNFKMGEEGIQLGVNRMGTKSSPIMLPLSDRTAHTAIIGKTGRGKSSLLHHMIHQDIAAGRGVCVIDPNGNLISDLLQHSIPEQRESDVIILDVSTAVDGVFYPPPLNLFVSGIVGDQQFQAAQRLVSLFALADNEFAEKRMGNTLRQALMAVQSLPNPTINDVHCLLFDEDYRLRLLPQIENDIVATYWRKFDIKKENEQANISQPLEWRIERFMLNPRLRCMTCHPLRLNFGSLMAANKIILVSLGDASDTLPKDEINLMGAALLMQLEYAARRKVVTKPPFMVYLDEAQQFVDTNLRDMLSQLRSYGIGLVLANQYFGQLMGKTFKAVEGNISTLIAFEIGKDDASTLLPYLAPNFTDSALVSLGKYTAAISMLDADGRRQPAFTLETLPPPGQNQRHADREVYLRRKVVEQWGLKPYDEVHKLVKERYADCGASAITPTTKPTTPAESSGANLEFFE